MLQIGKDHKNQSRAGQANRANRGFLQQGQTKNLEMPKQIEQEELAAMRLNFASVVEPPETIAVLDQPAARFFLQ